MPLDGQSQKKRVRVPDPSALSAAKQIVGTDYALPPPYPEPLAKFVQVYRATDLLPPPDWEKLNARPNDTFRMFPAKYRRALSYASPEARLVFFALWSQHEERRGAANGLLLGSIEWLSDEIGIKHRNAISDAILELEVRGIVRVMRGRGGRKAQVNLFLLTGFPDCLGNPPVLDYEAQGLPHEQIRSNSDEARLAEQRLLVERFQSRIAHQIVLTRFTRSKRENQ